MPKIDYNEIYELVKLIPKGKVTTYGAIAAAIGSKGAARVVGYAMNLSHHYHNIPAHRVVNRNGQLTGKLHFETITKMQELLESEGLQIENDQIVDFEKYFWHPNSII